MTNLLISVILKVARKSIYYKKYCIYSAIFSKQPRSTIFKVLSNDMYLIYLISQNVVSAQLMMFYLARKHCVNYDLEVIYCETASHKLKQKRKSLSFILKRNRDYLSSFVLLLWPNKRSTVWKLIESPTKRKHFCSYIFSSIRYL